MIFNRGKASHRTVKKTRDGLLVAIGYVYCGKDEYVVCLVYRHEKRADYLSLMDEDNVVNINDIMKENGYMNEL